MLRHLFWCCNRDIWLALWNNDLWRHTWCLNLSFWCDRDWRWFRPSGVGICWYHRSRNEVWWWAWWCYRTVMACTVCERFSRHWYDSNSGKLSLFYITILHFPEALDQRDTPDDKGIYSYRQTNNRRNRLQINLSQNIGRWGSVYLNGYQQDYWGMHGAERSIGMGYSTTRVTLIGLLITH